MNIIDKKLKNILYNAILSWFEDSYIEYKGLDDEKFIERVCEQTGLTKEDYRKLMLYF